MILFGRDIRAGEVVTVAELSCNHKGSIDKLKDLIQDACIYGATAAKIQVYTPDCMTLDNGFIIPDGKWEGRELYKLYEDTQTPLEWVPELFEYANNIKFPLFASVFSEDGLAVLEEVGCPVYKIASFEATDFRLIKSVMKTKKPIIVSAGMMDTRELLKLKAVLGEYPSVVMHCVSKYPTPYEYAQLDNLLKLGEMFDNIGYSDHTQNMLPAQYAVVLGARVIEKHMKGFQGGSEDDEFSFSPVKFKIYTKGIERVLSCVVPRGNYDSDSKILRRGLYASQDIKAGEKLRKYNTDILRPCTGLTISALEYYDVVGKTFAKDLKKGDPILYDNLIGVGDYNETNILYDNLKYSNGESSS